MIVFLFIAFIVPVASVTTYNFLTKGFADTLYCKITDGCDGSSVDTSTIKYLDLSNNIYTVVYLNLTRSDGNVTHTMHSGTEYLYKQNHIYE